MIPSLIEQGLLKTNDFYQLPPTHFYSVQSVVLTLAIMALSRIKNPEQLKQCKPGEIGRIIGLDRIPETKNLRKKIQLFSDQNQAQQLNNDLIDHWYKAEDKAYDFATLYVDGHQRIYYGASANIPKKFISRQKLCLSATTEYWVNDAKGMPLMVISSELTEKMKTMIEQEIIPQLQATVIWKKLEQNRRENDPVLTLVFDREVHEPDFFIRLWDQYRIAIITYRKNVKDKWSESNFKPVLSDNKTMLLCEKELTISGHIFREIRRLGKSGHQTAVLTTNPTLTMREIAHKMFYRWTQENFFKYMIADYEFDKMIEFGVDTILTNKEVVNPGYRKIDYQIKKTREKKGRVQAKLFPLIDSIMDESIDQIPELTAKQQEYIEQIDAYQKIEDRLIKQRSNTPGRITLDQMSDDEKYDKLKTESKLFMNIMKMICYRAETAVANLLAPHLKREIEEKRMLVKQIISNNADIIPDYENQTLTIALHTLSAPRFNEAAKELAALLNDTQTIFPATNLLMKFKLMHL